MEVSPFSAAWTLFRADNDRGHRVALICAEGSYPFPLRMRAPTQLTLVDVLIFSDSKLATQRRVIFVSRNQSFSTIRIKGPFLCFLLIQFGRRAHLSDSRWLRLVHTQEI